jgi:hypothetical protein
MLGLEPELVSERLIRGRWQDWTVELVLDAEDRPPSLIVKISRPAKPLSGMSIDRYVHQKGRRELKTYDQGFDARFDVRGPPDEALSVLTPALRRLLLGAGSIDLKLRDQTLSASFPVASLRASSAWIPRVMPIFAIASQLAAVAPEHRASRLYANLREEDDESVRLALLEALLDEYRDTDEARLASADAGTTHAGSARALLVALKESASTEHGELLLRALGSELEVIQHLGLGLLDGLELDVTLHKALLDRIEGLKPELRVYGIWLLIRRARPAGVDQLGAEDHARLSALREEHARFMA